MTFDYRSLRNAERNGQRIGNWNGKPVFAASAAHLDGYGSGAYYIVYDDNNIIVRKNEYGRWQSYGSVSESGNVNEYSRPRNYGTETTGRKQEAAKTEPVAKATSYAPGYDRAERPVGDVKLEIDVEATLKKAREMSVEDLLEGFNYGLDVAKG